MFAKRIKDSQFDFKKENIIISKLKDVFYYPIHDTYNMYSDRISRSLAFARFGWTNHDFDFGYTYQIMTFKLKRLHACLLDGHAEQEEGDLAALLEAIAICERLNLGDHDDKYLEVHDKKWGVIEVNRDEVARRDENGKPTSYYWKTSREHVNDENKAQESKEFKKCFVNGEKDRCADIDQLASFLKTTSPRLWD